jgi:hypothetical protein
MKWFIFIFSLLLVTNLDVAEVRDLYRKAVESEAEATALYAKLQDVNENDDKVLVGYKGALTAITAKYEKEVKTKKERFKTGVSLIEYAVSQEPDNVELRFIRLSIQQNSPKFLKYKKNISEDKALIFDNLENLENAKLKAHIEDYILYSKNFSEQEKNVISQ